MNAFMALLGISAVKPASGKTEAVSVNSKTSEAISEKFGIILNDIISADHNVGSADSLRMLLKNLPMHADAEKVFSGYFSTIGQERKNLLNILKKLNKSLEKKISAAKITDTEEKTVDETKGEGIKDMLKAVLQTLKLLDTAESSENIADVLKKAGNSTQSIQDTKLRVAEPENITVDNNSKRVQKKQNAAGKKISDKKEDSLKTEDAEKEPADEIVKNRLNKRCAIESDTVVSEDNKKIKHAETELENIKSENTKLENVKSENIKHSKAVLAEESVMVEKSDNEDVTEKESDTDTRSDDGQIVVFRNFKHQHTEERTDGNITDLIEKITLFAENLLKKDTEAASEKKVNNDASFFNFNKLSDSDKNRVKKEFLQLKDITEESDKVLRRQQIITELKSVLKKCAENEAGKNAFSDAVSRQREYSQVIVTNNTDDLPQNVGKNLKNKKTVRKIQYEDMKNTVLSSEGTDVLKKAVVEHEVPVLKNGEIQMMKVKGQTELFEGNISENLKDIKNQDKKESKIINKNISNKIEHSVSVPSGNDFKSEKTEEIFSRLLKDPVPANMPETVRKTVIQQVRFQVRNEVSSMTVQLRPDNLGKIHMKVDFSQKDGISARIVVENEDVKSAVETNVAQIKSELTAQGIEVAKIDVVLQSEASMADSREKEGENPRKKQKKQYKAKKSEGIKTEKTEKKENADGYEINLSV